MLKQAKKLTEANGHTGAYLTVSKFFKFNNSIKLLTAIQQIQFVENCLPNEIQNYRYDVYCNMLLAIEQDYGMKIRNEVYNCL